MSVNDGKHQRGRHGRIDGIATTVKGRHSRFASQRIHGGYHSAIAPRGVLIRTF
jgi:hypothetical protein